MPLRLNSPMPALAGATEWLPAAPTGDDLAGHPVLVYFWAVSCHICHERMPALAALRDRYAPQGLRLVAVHMPRQESDTDVGAVRREIASLGITDPCAVDNEHALADAFENRFLPSFFLFDREGLLRSRTAGDAGIGMLEGALARQFASAA
jgi:thiol-disulfide isomerase/thioredoxin